MKNKGSAPVYGLEYIIFILIVVLVIVGVTHLVGSFMNIKLQSKGVENSIFIKRILYEPGLIIYEDNDLGRKYPGVIDQNKFDAARLDEIFHNQNNRLAAIVELKNLDTEEIKTIYINEERARAWEDYAPLGNFDTSYIKRYVRIYDNNEFMPGLLKLRVIVKNN